MPRTNIINPIDLEVRSLRVQREATILGRAEVEDGISFKGSDPYFHMLVSGRHYNENPLPEAFDNCLVLDTHEIKNVNFMELALWDAENERPSLVLNQGAPGRATLIERSLIIGAQKGTKALDGNYTLGNDFPNLSFDTSQFGADVGVENDMEVKGIVYANQIKQSTGTEVKINKLKVDDLWLDYVRSDLINVDSVQVNDNVRLLNLAGGGNRIVKVDNNGDLYAE